MVGLGRLEALVGAFADSSLRRNDGSRPRFIGTLHIFRVQAAQSTARVRLHLDSASVMAACHHRSLSSRVDVPEDDL